MRCVNGAAVHVVNACVQRMSYTDGALNCAEV
jgi:hypothetical protein